MSCFRLNLGMCLFVFRGAIHHISIRLECNMRKMIVLHQLRVTTRPYSIKIRKYRSFQSICIARIIYNNQDTFENVAFFILILWHPWPPPIECFEKNLAIRLPI